MSDEDARGASHVFVDVQSCEPERMYSLGDR